LDHFEEEIRRHFEGDVSDEEDRDAKLVVVTFETKIFFEVIETSVSYSSNLARNILEAKGSGEERVQIPILVLSKKDKM